MYIASFTIINLIIHPSIFWSKTIQCIKFFAIAVELYQYHPISIGNIMDYQIKLTIPVGHEMD